MDPSNDFSWVEMFVLKISHSIFIFPLTSKEHPTRIHIFFQSSTELPALSVCVESFFRVSNKITVTIFTMSGGGGALGLVEALENRVWPLVEGGELKRLEGADGQTGERKKRNKRMKKRGRTEMDGWVN